jgi:hypothetical protein
VKGIDAVAGAADEVASTHHMRAAAQDDDALGKIKGMIFAFFAPALLLAVIGGLGVARKKFGRGAGVLSLLVGLIGLGVGALLNSAAEGDGGIAITMLIITGLAGTVGGILAIAKPDRGAAPVGVAPMARLAA